MCEHVPIEPATFNRPLATVTVEFSAKGILPLPSAYQMLILNARACHKLFNVANA